jgi:hypothetical protein
MRGRLLSKLVCVNFTKSDDLLLQSLCRKCFTISVSFSTLANKETSIASVIVCILKWIEQINEIFQMPKKKY